MAQDEEDGGTTGARVPPYIAFQTLKTFLDELQKHGTPNRIDRSVLTRFSGSVGSQLLGALKFLQLITDEARPTNWLTELVTAYGTDEWPRRLSKLLKDCYAPVFRVNLERATPSEFNEAFRQAYPAKENVLRKCTAFFLNAVRESGTEVSPRILKNSKPRSTNGTARKKPSPKAGTNGHAATAAPVTPAEGTQTNTHDPQDDFRKDLLAKFPAFDPNWPDNIKAEWFKGFEQFMAMAKKQ
ncbi:DUF5343 domain-containing protein [Mesorhizobium sp. WSM3876]|uniref:DUF5343 domain-containing protein n=1 Tax=Mesorhizobium sp. WSM3876 TaxID=422277 RepID=UPI000BD4CF94|nr:DUF5343 domain-containing protein [Mesorhizobium sp. WSM3876]PBB84588.1 hypothetical protein CK216_21935 [Mesorhizobium sp. WSM3876]